MPSFQNNLNVTFIITKEISFFHYKKIPIVKDPYVKNEAGHFLYATKIIIFWIIFTFVSPFIKLCMWVWRAGLIEREVGWKIIRGEKIMS